jgi:SulP family sulfate permease
MIGDADGGSCEFADVALGSAGNFHWIFCILAGLLRLGFAADFLAKPIHVRFLNGVAIHIFFGHIGKVFGFSMKSHGIMPSLLEFIEKMPQTHCPRSAWAHGR